MLWTLLAACSTCPDGFVREGGMCTPDGTAPVPPLSAENFPSRFGSQGCRELEDCICDDLEGDYTDCDVDCDDADWSWAEGCAFDLEQAEQCLSDSWACDEDDWFVEAPASCLLVYDCSPPDTGTR